MDVLTILVASGAAGSRADARRLVQQGGVHVNGALVQEVAATFGPDDLLTGRYLLVRRGRRDQRMIVRGLGRA
jgi:tyrosyl-tRNA synthetase